MAPPALLGIHHLKFPVADLERSLAFYCLIFAARHVEAWDHRHPDGSRYAVILDVPGLGSLLELRLDVESANQQAEFDPVTFAVRDRSALKEWINHLDAAGIDHSPVLVSIQAWLVVFADLDARRLRLYTQETHGPELQPNGTWPWITGSLPKEKSCQTQS